MATHYHKPALSMQVLFAWCYRLRHFIDCALGDGSLKAYVTLETLWHELGQGWTKPSRVLENLVVLMVQPGETPAALSVAAG
jgi:hypothetical protein